MLKNGINVIKVPQEKAAAVQDGVSLNKFDYDDQKFQKFHLEGAISLAEFKSKVSALGQDQEIIFY